MLYNPHSRFVSNQKFLKPIVLVIVWCLSFTNGWLAQLLEYPLLDNIFF